MTSLFATLIDASVSLAALPSLLLVPATALLEYVPPESVSEVVAVDGEPLAQVLPSVNLRGTQKLMLS